MATIAAGYQEPRRELPSFTGDVEKRVLAVLADALPRWITPDHLTALGFASMGLVGLAYRLSGLDQRFLLLANLGLFLNWFGDSLDGTLARRRNCPRPRYGFYLDHVVDALGAALLLLGLAASGLCAPLLAAALLVSYLLLQVHVALAAAAGGSFRIAYGGVGGTELRLLLGAVNLLALAWPGLRLLEVAAVAACAAVLLTLLLQTIATARALERTDLQARA